MGGMRYRKSALSRFAGSPQRQLRYAQIAATPQLLVSGSDRLFSRRAQPAFASIAVLLCPNAPSYSFEFANRLVFVAPHEAEAARDVRGRDRGEDAV
jgi:hypothetical protein